MDALSVNPIRPVALGALDAVRPPQVLPVPAADSSQPARATPLTLQDLAQTLFQRSLQAATLFPVAPTATGTASLVQEATASLLASLSAQGSAAPAQVAAAAPSTAPSTAPPSAPPAPTVQELPAPQDALATSLSPEFAMQTALRFGAGVQAQAALAVPVGELGAGLVRDATQVLRTGPLQPQGGGPGPEAFTRAQATLQRVLRSYEAAAVPARGNAALDLLA